MNNWQYDFQIFNKVSTFEIMQMMREKNTRLKSVFVFLIIFLFSTSCVDEYWPDLEINTDQLLVIDGKITNLPGPYTIKLSTSSSIFNESTQLPLSNAKVIILDNHGLSEVLTEVEIGVYKTSIGGIQGTIGNSYKIRIEISNDNIYESEFTEMQDPVAIESLSLEESTRITEDDLKIEQEGYQFYVNSQEANKSKTYLYWEIEETYEYHADYKISYYFDGNFYEKTTTNPYGITVMRNIDSLFYCWTTQKVPERFSYSTEYLSLPKVNNLPLHFIPFSDKRLRYKYSIMVTQYTISEEAYVFIDKLNQQNGNSDELFTTQPFQIRGNIANINNPNEAVLGYFMVASAMTGPRIITKAPSRIRYYSLGCESTTDYKTIMTLLNQATTASLPILFTMVAIENDGGAPLSVMGYVHRKCIDCEKKGGTVIKPDYWDD